MSQIYQIFEADSFPAKITVTDEATGEPLDMDNITWEAFAQGRATGDSLPATVTVLGAGELLVRFAPDTFGTNTYQVQVRGTRGDDVQTLQPPLTVTVSRSIRGG